MRAGRVVSPPNVGGAIPPPNVGGGLSAPPKVGGKAALKRLEEHHPSKVTTQNRSIHTLGSTLLSSVAPFLIIGLNGSASSSRTISLFSNSSDP